MGYSLWGRKESDVTEPCAHMHPDSSISLSLSHTHTHAHTSDSSVSLSLSHTHTHTYIHTPLTPMSLSLSHTCAHTSDSSVSVSLSHTHTHTPLTPVSQTLLCSAESQYKLYRAGGLLLAAPSMMLCTGAWNEHEIYQTKSKNEVFFQHPSTGQFGCFPQKAFSFQL